MLVTVPLSPVVTKLESESAALNSAAVPVTTFEARDIDLFENVFVEDALTVISEVRATVPVVVGRVSVPVFVIEDITGDVKVLFVRVSAASFNRVPFKYSDFPEARFTCSDEVHESVASTQLKVLSVVPFNVIPPPSAVASDGVAIVCRCCCISKNNILIFNN